MNKLVPLISTEKISKVYDMNFGKVFSLTEVDFKIYTGDSISIMGPSGSGKSTLLHLLGCLDRPSSGEIFFQGIGLSSLNDAELSSIRSREIGFVFQSFNLLPHLNVYENIMLPFQYQENLPQNYKEEVLNVVERVGLSHRLHHRTNELSGGEMQRAAIARALVIKPSMILADEPTGNLDSTNSETIISLLKDVNATGVTLVVITHDAKVASQFRKNYKMNDGVLYRHHETD